MKYLVIVLIFIQSEECVYNIMALPGDVPDVFA
jgi:hypothetical protein